MTRNEFAVILAKISRFYPRFYEGQDAENVANNWYSEGGFDKISYPVVERAIKAYFNTAKFPPSLADIKSQIVESYLQDKPTAMQAFQRISAAVKKSIGRDEAIMQFNELPPILRKLVGEPSVLLDWNKVSTESFQTVIMSSIRESYKELTAREAKYYAFPEELQMAEQWRVSAPEMVSLPEPKKEPTIDDMLAERERKEKEYREKHLPERTPEIQNRINALLEKWNTEPIEDVQRRVDLREQRKFDLLSKQ